jgi:hypothetical protein
MGVELNEDGNGVLDGDVEVVVDGVDEVDEGVELEEDGVFDEVVEGFPAVSVDCELWGR